MTKLEQAARQALIESLGEAAYRLALSYKCFSIDKEQYMEKFSELLHTALREALAEQAEQKPVAYVLWGDNNVPSLQWEKPNDGVFNQLYYAAPVQQVDLTDDEIISALDADMDTDEDKARFLEIARAVIAAYKEKNK